ncbi:MAG: BatA domain-containing protein [Chthoniobacteraceae bacterium]|nr:BatA domain-containing protein [Chthoniobacteraceae bacterium]
MDLSFGNPAAGAWALLGIPAILAIHFLQTRSRPIAVSTLFLLDRLDPRSAGGRRWDRLRQSVPLWLQLICVLLLAWLLAQPRLLRRDPAQTVLVLLDSSVSMRAFEKPLRETLPGRLRLLERGAARTEWMLLETDPAAQRLYAGARLEGVTAALAQWRPRLGTHDFQPALRAGLTLLKGRGVLVFVTDRPVPVPPGVELLAVGRPLENAGFSGVRVTDEGWEALVRNFGAAPQRRAWHLEDRAGNRLGEDRALLLPPGGSETLKGTFAQAALRIVLDADGFAMDDALPLVRPRAKRLRVAVEGNAEPLKGWLEAFLRSEPALERGGNGLPGLRIGSFDPAAPAAATVAAKPAVAPVPGVLFAAAAGEPSGLQTGEIVAEKDPLSAGLTWAGLLVPAGAPALTPGAGDTVLLWQGDRPLLVRRGADLLVAFDFAHSNAARLPAFVLLLHRFVEAVRAAAPGPESANFETNQSFALAGAADGGLRRAPVEPGFFEAGEGDAKLTGAAHFADPRESDFQDAASVDRVEGAAKARRERSSRQDPLTPLWVLLLGGLLAANWIITERRAA